MVQGLREGGGAEEEGRGRKDVGKGADSSWVWNMGQMQENDLEVKRLRRVAYGSVYLDKPFASRSVYRPAVSTPQPAPDKVICP